MHDQVVRTIHYKAFAMEAAKITLFCLMTTGLFALFKVSNNTLLVVFNMAVMSSAATFSVEHRRLKHVVLGSSVMITSIVVGGVIGYYYPLLAKLLTILYAGLAFYLPKTKYKSNIFVTSSVMFLVFSTLPFNWIEGIGYALDGLIVFSIFILFYFLFDAKMNSIKNKDILSDQYKDNHHAAMIAVLSLIISWSIHYFLSIYFHFSHLYWIELTALVIIQGSQQKTIQTSLKRILINIFGATVVVLLFNNIPPIFLMNFMVLVLFLFLIFFLSFSYVGRVFFIELFVLSFVHLFGDYHNAIVLDRVMLTLIGGMIVIFSTLMIYFFCDDFKLE
jgi:hypothetical protein